MNNDEIVVPILRAINDLREEVRDNKREIREMREENNKRWDENDKRWEENNIRWEKYKKDRERDHKETLDLFIRYDAAVSKKLGDSNANKMLKLLK